MSETAIVTRHMRLRKQVMAKSFCVTDKIWAIWIKLMSNELKINHLRFWHCVCEKVLEPSDNGLTFEGLIDALMVSIVHINSQVPLLSTFVLFYPRWTYLGYAQVLYEECSQVKAKNRSQQISAFISTFQVILLLLLIKCGKSVYCDLNYFTFSC